MIKASAGGGGKGMRIAFSKGEVAEGFARARSEAKSSFGDDRVFIEKFITDPRHVEIQVLGDKHGNVIHLGERECSIQRRNQKVVEEAPSPLLDAKTRAQDGRAGGRAGQGGRLRQRRHGRIRRRAGRSFYFLEMNTRLQVEHPVTELVTGIDLVEQMIRVAAGEKLALQQSDIKLSGWAVESRVYAEDPYRNFLPSIGRLVRYRPPAEEHARRRDRAQRHRRRRGRRNLALLRSDDRQARHPRADARASDRRAGDALDAFTIEGIRHNIPFLAALMQHPRWRAGKLSTGFIAEEFPERLRAVRPTRRGGARDRRRRRRHRSRARRAQAPNLRPAERRGDARAPPRGLARRATRFRLDVARDGEAITVLFEDGKRVTSLVVATGCRAMPVWSGTLDGVAIAVQVRAIPNGFELAHRGIEVEDLRLHRARGAAARG